MDRGCIALEIALLSAEAHIGNSKASRRGSYGRVLYNRFRYYDPSLGRYISADPIGLRAGPNLYTYAANDAVNAIDPFGLKVRYQYGQSAAFKKKFGQAIQYMNAGGAGGTFAQLEAHEGTIYIEEGEGLGDTYFDPSTSTIIWNPNAAWQETTPPPKQPLDCKGLQSPALNLLHEGGHALNFLRDPAGQNRRANSGETPDGFSNQEERQVILETENPAATRLGEPTRGSDWGVFVPVPCPTCR